MVKVDLFKKLETLKLHASMVITFLSDVMLTLTLLCLEKKFVGYPARCVFANESCFEPRI